MRTLLLYLHLAVSLSYFRFPHEPLLHNVNELWKVLRVLSVVSPNCSTLEEHFFVFQLDFDILAKAYLLHSDPAINEWTRQPSLSQQVFFCSHCPAQQEYLAPARSTRADTFLLPDVLSS